MRCFVTGGSGFIGQALIKGLEEENNKTFNYDILEGYDVKNEGQLVTEIDNFDPDIIFHFAGVLGTSSLMSNPIMTEEVNVIGTINVLDMAVGFKIPVIFASKPIPTRWYNPYNISKQAAELYCKMYQTYYDVHVTILKFFNVYGPGQRYTKTQKFIPSFIHHAIRDEPIPIYGSGNQLVDPIYVDDCVRAAIRVMDAAHFSTTLEIGLGQPYRVRDIAQMVLNLTGSKSKFKSLPMRPGEVEYDHEGICANTTFYHNPIFGWDDLVLTPPVTGLIKTIDWWKENDL